MVAPHALRRNGFARSRLALLPPPASDVVTNSVDPTAAGPGALSERMRAGCLTTTLELTENVVMSLARAVAARDGATGEHLQRLAAYAQLVGRWLGLCGPALEALRYGALLHDVGKIGIDDAILHKPGPLTDDEFRQMQQHPLIGEQIVQPLRLAAQIAPIVRGHHERWDGGGYPDGLAGDAIHPGARIVAVIDSFDAMTALRPYSRPMTIADAIARLGAGAGSQWDPDVVDALIACLEREERNGECERAVGEGCSWPSRRLSS